jgi:hypothetical protein
LANGHSCMLSLVMGNHFAAGNEKIYVVHYDLPTLQFFALPSLVKECSPQRPAQQSRKVGLSPAKAQRAPRKTNSYLGGLSVLAREILSYLSPI